MSAVTVWRYQLPSNRGEGWAIAFLDSIGVFTVVSDWGDYGYRWPQNGWGQGDFREFLVECDADYVRRKIATKKVYDGDDTLRSVKDAILSARRGRTWSRHKARNEWDSLEDHGNLDAPENFAVWLEHTSLDEAYEFSCYGPDPHAVEFMRNVWPRLRQAIRAELESEKAAVAS